MSAAGDGARVFWVWLTGCVAHPVRFHAAQRHPFDGPPERRDTLPACISVPQQWTARHRRDALRKAFGRRVVG